MEGCAMNEQPILVVVENMDEDRIMEVAGGPKNFSKWTNWVSSAVAVVALVVVWLVLWRGNWFSLAAGLLVVVAIHLVMHFRKKKPVNVHATTVFFEGHIHEISARNGTTLVNRTKSYDQVKLATETNDAFTIKHAMPFDKNVLPKAHLTQEQATVLRDLLLHKLGERFKEVR